jgi:MFS superfamily sulfate permease-like transporter
MVIDREESVLIRFSKDVSFLQKNRLRALLRDMADNREVVIDGSRSVHVDHDIVELVTDFVESAPSRNIKVTLQKSPLALCEMFKG